MPLKIGHDTFVGNSPEPRMLNKYASGVCFATESCAMHAGARERSRISAAPRCWLEPRVGVAKST